MREITPRRQYDLQLWRWNQILTLSSERLAVKVYGEEETDYLETHTHLIEILKCIVDKKT